MTVLRTVMVLCVSILSSLMVLKRIKSASYVLLHRKLNEKLYTLLMQHAKH